MRLLLAEDDLDLGEGLLKALQKDPVNIVLLFAAGITLGMADFGLEDIIKKLSSLTLNSDI